MAPLFRALAALLMMLMHALSRGSFGTHPIFRLPTAVQAATATATATLPPTPVPTASATAVPTHTATLPPTVTQSPSRTPSSTATSTSTSVPTATNTLTPLPTSTHTWTALPTRTATASATVTYTGTTTPSQTAVATSTHTVTQTSVPTSTSTATHTATPSATLTDTTTKVPTGTPTTTPPPTATLTDTATKVPTGTPTTAPPSTATATSAPVDSSSAPDPTGFDVVGAPPAQTLPSALLIYPLIQASATQDTRVEIMNLTNAPVSVNCFYVASVTCNEIGFFLTLTANQPVSWMASTGASGHGARVAPPFTGEGELKCVVTTQSSALSSHNALQGRAIVSDSTGQTVGYAAIAFRRLAPGPFTGEVSLDGVTYEQCPDRLHFNVLTSQAGSDSELILVPCSEDLEGQVASRTVILFSVINELEQPFSGAALVNCFDHRRFSTVAPLHRSTVGTDTAHVIVRANDVPVVGLVIDRFTVPGSSALSTSSNEPYLEGGRSATLIVP